VIRPLSVATFGSRPLREIAPEGWLHAIAAALKKRRWLCIKAPEIADDSAL
jgi:hypothetical protein